VPHTCPQHHATLTATWLSPSCCSVGLTCSLCASGTCNTVLGSPGIEWPSIFSSQALVYWIVCFCHACGTIRRVPSFLQARPQDMALGSRLAPAREVTPESSLPRRGLRVLFLSTVFYPGLWICHRSSNLRFLWLVMELPPGLAINSSSLRPEESSKWGVMTSLSRSQHGHLRVCCFFQACFFNVFLLFCLIDFLPSCLNCYVLLISLEYRFVLLFVFLCVFIEWFAYLLLSFHQQTVYHDGSV